MYVGLECQSQSRWSKSSNTCQITSIKF